MKLLRFVFGGPWLLILSLAAATIVWVSCGGGPSAAEDAAIKARAREALHRQHGDADKAIRDYQRSQLRRPAPAPVAPEDQIQ